MQFDLKKIMNNLAHLLLQVTRRNRQVRNYQTGTQR